MTIDRSYFANPLLKYLRWLLGKIKYQFKYRNSFLRIGYYSFINNSTFSMYNWIGQFVQVSNSSLGDYTYVNDYSSINNAKIGKFCSIAQGVKIGPGKHPTSVFVSTHPSTYYNPTNLLGDFNVQTNFKYYEQVNIGNDVWIGANAIIVDGVSIADGAIIAANSVVTKDVLPYSIVVGIPAEHKRFRFAENDIQFLLSTQWWNKDRNWIKEHINDFHSIDVFQHNFFNEC